MATLIPAELEEIDKEFCPVSFHRKNVRCFRIERLFSFEGHKFVFGFYYARPHEVYCEPGKLFHEKEVNFSIQLIIIWWPLLFDIIFLTLL